MNERIRELAEQAMVTNNRGDGYYNRILDPEKFAELIIKETLQVARAGIEYGDGMESAVYRYFDIK